MASSWNIRLKKKGNCTIRVVKGADQLRSYCTADLCLFSHMIMVGKNLMCSCCSSFIMWMCAGSAVNFKLSLKEVIRLCCKHIKGSYSEHLYNIHKQFVQNLDCLFADD